MQGKFTEYSRPHAFLWNVMFNFWNMCVGAESHMDDMLWSIQNLSVKSNGQLKSPSFSPHHCHFLKLEVKHLNTNTWVFRARMHANGGDIRRNVFNKVVQVHLAYEPFPSQVKKNSPNSEIHLSLWFLNFKCIRIFWGACLKSKISSPF